MLRAAITLAGLLFSVAAFPAAQRSAAPPSIDLVEIDVAVVDGRGQPVRGLKQADFLVKEDGAPVELTTFSEVVSIGADSVRTVVVLLDDSGVPASGTLTIQTIARAFVRSADPPDEVSIVRLHNRNDEPFGDRQAAEFRIAQYQAGLFPVTNYMQEDVLDRIAAASRLLPSDDHRRKAIVCVGAPAVCNIPEPVQSSSSRVFWTSWVQALTTAARANVAVYALIPGRPPLRGGELAELTGGEVLASMNDLRPAVDRILRDAANYYMLGYWPSGKSRELHSIDVKVARKGVKTYARHRRGN